MDWFIEETEYSPNEEVEYVQVFEDEMPEHLRKLNQLYLEGEIESSDVRHTSNTTLGFRPVNNSDEIITEDGYEWEVGIRTVRNKLKEHMPFFNQEEIAVLFPSKKDNSGIAVKNETGYEDELEKYDLTIVQHWYERRQDLINTLEDSSAPSFDRSINVYATPDTNEEYIDQKLDDLITLLTEENWYSSSISNFSFD